MRTLHARCFTGEAAPDRSVMGCLVLAGRFNQLLVRWWFGRRATERAQAVRVGDLMRGVRIDKECGTLVNFKMKVGSLLYNVWRPQYNPEVLRACVSSRGVHESCSE